MKHRSQALAKRAEALPEVELMAAAAVPLPEALATAAGSSGVLVAEGDSWFDYPWTDVLRLLEDDHGYDVESVSHKGDRVEEMAYSGGQLEEFSRRLEKLLRNDKIPKAILLSGGGNDVAGSEFGHLCDRSPCWLSQRQGSAAAGKIRPGRGNLRRRSRRFGETREDSAGRGHLRRNP